MKLRELDPNHTLITNRIEQGFWWLGLVTSVRVLVETRAGIAAAGVLVCAVMCWASWLGGLSRRRGLEEVWQQREALRRRAASPGEREVNRRN